MLSQSALISIEALECNTAHTTSIIDVLLGAGSEGMLPKDIAARLAKYEVSRWHVSRRLVRMNKRLKKEIDQNLAEKHGWKWATTSFINENWGATKEDLCLTTKSASSTSQNGWKQSRLQEM